MNVFEGTLVAENGQLIFDGGNIRCPLPPEKAQRLNGRANQRVCLGIRPRALLPASADERAETVFEGRVEVSEMLGEEVLVHMVSGAHEFTASLHPHEAARLPHENVRVVPDLELAHIFDAETGRNLTLPEEVAGATLPDGRPE